MAADDARDLHAKLYMLSFLIQFGSANLKADIQKGEGASHVQQFVDPALRALTYNPTCYHTWDTLASRLQQSQKA